MNTPKKILVPLDFSETSEHALAYAIALAKPCEAQLQLLHVIVDPYSQTLALAASGVDVPEVLGRWEANARRRVDEMKLDVTSADLVTTVGEPFLEIVRYAERHDIDLIVMGTHGRGAVAHLLLGSVAENVVRLAPCPVLTLRHPDHGTEHA